jgi:phosphatidylglycerophosphate synthase
MHHLFPSLNNKVAAVLSPFLKPLHVKLGLTPNKITILSFCIGSVAPFLILFNHLGIALIVLLFALIFDGLDGAMARFLRQESKHGEKLDLIFDRTNEAMLFFALAYKGYTSVTISLLAFSAIILLSSVKERSKLDPGCKRVMLFVGYFFGNFELALAITFVANLAGFVVGLLILDYRYQKDTDFKSAHL